MDTANPDKDHNLERIVARVVQARGHHRRWRHLSSTDREQH